MAVTATNLTAGAGTIYGAPFGSTEPAAGAAPATPFVDLGGTTDGVTVSVSTDFLELEVDQLIETPERRVTKRETTIATNLAETTLDNLALAQNVAAPAAAVAGVRTLELPGDLTGYKPPYTALIFDGPGVGGGVSRVIGRKMLSTEGTEFAYQKDAERVFSVTWTAHYVSSAIKSVRFADITA
jgi:hypothetical protein